LKRIATIFLIIFTLVQTIPAIQSFAPDAKVSLFSPDEEKADKGDTVKQDKQETKDLTEYVAFTGTADRTVTLYRPAGVRLHPSPYVEHHTPPPNFM